MEFINLNLIIILTLLFHIKLEEETLARLWQRGFIYLNFYTLKN